MKDTARLEIALVSYQSLSYINCIQSLIRSVWEGYIE